jgi:hypothetical protein
MGCTAVQQTLNLSVAGLRYQALGLFLGRQHNQSRLTVDAIFPGYIRTGIFIPIQIKESDLLFIIGVIAAECIDHTDLASAGASPGGPEFQEY